MDEAGGLYAQWAKPGREEQIHLEMVGDPWATAHVSLRNSLPWREEGRRGKMWTGLVFKFHQIK